MCARGTAGEIRNAEDGRGWHCGLGKRGCHWFASDLATLAKRCPRFARGIAALAKRCPRFAHDLAVLAGALLSIHAFGLAVLSPRFVLVSRPVMRFYRGVLPSVRVRHYDSIAAFCLRSRLSFFPCQEKRDGLRCVAFLFRRVEIATRAFSRRWCGYLPLRVHFGLDRLFAAISTGLPEYGVRGTGLAARPLCVFAQSHWP